MCGLTQPDQEFMYCYKGNHELLEQYISLPGCHDFQMNRTCRAGENYIGKVRVSQVNAFFVSTLSFVLTYCLPSCSLQFSQRLNKKAGIKDGHLFRNQCWCELGLGMIANDSNINMAEEMAFSCHSNPSSHTAYIQAGHNSDFAGNFLKHAVEKDATKEKVFHKKKCKLPKDSTYIKAPPLSKKLIHVATHAATAAVRQSVRVHKPKKLE
jgi:hypothetical protein